MMLAREDTLRELHALALRLETGFKTWIAREGETGPRTARLLAHLATGVARRMRTDVENYDRKLADGADVESVSLVGLAQRARFIEQLHVLLDNCTYSSLSPVLSPTVRTELDSLDVRRGSVLVTGTRDVSYEIATFLRDDFAKLADETDLGHVDWPLRVFLVPQYPLDWPLHHVLLYHELGHAIAEPCEVVMPAELDPAKEPNMVAAMKVAAKQKDFIEFMKSWREEVFADCFGTVLAGPAYAMAFARLLGSHFGLAGASKTHPPTALRLELICDVVEMLGFDEALEEPEKAVLMSWAGEAKAISDYKTSDDPRLQAVLRFLISETRRLHNTILSEARAAVGTEREYSCENIQDDRRRGALLLRFGIPPIDSYPTEPGEQQPKLISPARIFGSTWMAYLKELESQPDISQLSHTAEKLAENLLGSLDAAEALRAWEASS